MSFYIRKSLKAGPFRVNLSKSGIGLSTGIPGFRVGTGPRGNYVHMGRHGVYYRTTLNGKQRAPSSPAAGGSPKPFLDVAPSDVLMDDCTGATTLEMAASSPSELLQQLNAAAAAPRLAVLAAVVLGTVSLGLMAVPPVGIAALLVTVVIVWWLRQRDEARRSVVVFYDVNDRSADAYQSFIGAFRQVASCHSGPGT
jgi:DNA polymerase-3 subunit epsilon